MSRVLRAVTVMVAIVAIPLATIAQEEEPASSFVYGTYFQCDPGDEWLADAIVDQLFAPVYDAAVADGTITAWGWLSHVAGGKWRRAIYHSASSLDALLDASETLGDKVGEANAAAAGKLGEICNVHDDYIWNNTNGSGGPGSAQVAMVDAKASISVYMACEMAGEERADEIVAGFAPVYESQVQAGGLASWGWLSHVVGGEYRRLLTMRGTDHKQLMASWGAIIDELTTNQAAAMTEFAQICGSHQDYLWNVR